MCRFAACLFIALTGCSSLTHYEYSVQGDSIRAGDQIATLLVARKLTGGAEDYTGRDVYRNKLNVQLLLTPLDGKTPPTKITIAEDQPRLAVQNEAKVLGDDGRHVWVFGTAITAVERSSGKVITVEQLNQINPALAKAWVNQSKYYSCGQRLRFTASDARKFEIDPATLQANSYAEPFKPKLTPREDNIRYKREMSMWGVGPSKFFWTGMLRSASEWFGILSESDLAKNYKPGDPVDVYSRNIRVDERTYLYRAAVAACGDDRRCLGQAERLAGDGYLGGVLLREAAEPKPLLLSNPGSVIVLHWSKIGAQGTLMAARVTFEGKSIWRVDTGIADLDQVLPGVPSTAFIGKAPASEGKPVANLVIIDTNTGKVAASQLQ